MKLAWGWKLPLSARPEIARRVRAGTPVGELVQEYGVHESRVYQILREQGIRLGAGDTASPDEAWVNAHLAVYDDDETRAWLGARLRAFLERWHEREQG